MNETFTTQPKGYVKRGTSTSRSRCQDFMLHLWTIRLKKCSYSTLEFEFIQFFGTNESRTLERYLGRQEITVRSSGKKLVRTNHTRGTVANFTYSTERKVSKRKGLLQILGYLEPVENGYYRIHHECMSYFSEQSTLSFLPQEADDSKVIIDNLCACSGGEGVVSNRETGENIEIEKKEEEAIDYTHANRLSESNNPEICKGDMPRGFLCSCGHQTENSFFCEVCGKRNVVTYG
jgi:hypothetical protein